MENRKRFWDKRCYICGAPADSFDHKVPRSKGGENSKANALPCCFVCNHAKGDLDFEAFYAIFTSEEWRSMGRLTRASRRGKIEAAKLKHGLKKPKKPKIRKG